MAVMVWSGSATHLSNCTLLWCPKYTYITRNIFVEKLKCVAQDHTTRRLTRSKAYAKSRTCRQIHLTSHFSHAVCRFNYMHVMMHGLRRATQRVFDCPLVASSCLSFSCFSPSFTSSLPHSTCTLPSTSSPCHQRLCLMRSIAPWRYTIVPQVMSPTSLTTSTTQRLLQ